MKPRTSSGFSLIELLLVIAIFSLIVGVAIPASRQLLLRNDLVTSTTTLRQVLRRAQHLAQSHVDQSEWGVHVGPSEIVLFRGTNYPSRDSSYDEVYQVAASLVFSGDNDVTFQRVSGTRNTPATITITNAVGANTQIQVSRKGVISE